MSPPPPPPTRSCVFGQEREREGERAREREFVCERERERYEGKTDRARGAHCCFWTHLGAEASRPQISAHAKIRKLTLGGSSSLPSINFHRVICFISGRGKAEEVRVSRQSAGQVWPLKDAPRDFDAHVPPASPRLDMGACDAKLR